MVCAVGRSPCVDLRLDIVISLSSVYRIWYIGLRDSRPSIGTGTRPEALEKQGKRLPAIFFRTDAGGEPVRDWLRGLSPDDRKRIGEDIKTVEFGWDDPAPRIHQENTEDAWRGLRAGKRR